MTTKPINIPPDAIADYFAVTASVNKHKIDTDTKEGELVKVENASELDVCFVNNENLDAEEETPQVRILIKEKPVQLQPKTHIVGLPTSSHATSAAIRAQQQVHAQKSNTPSILRRRVTTSNQLHVLAPNKELVPVKKYEKGDQSLLLYKGNAFCAIKDFDYTAYGFVQRGNKFIDPNDEDQKLVLDCGIM